MNRISCHRLLLAALMVAGLLASCGRKTQVAPERPSPFPTGLFETVWVNPQMVFSDSLVTLIRAERIDSLPIEPSNLAAKKQPVLGFAIDEPTTTVTINLVDEKLRLIYPLLLQKLPAGFYKLTLNPLAIRKPSLPPGVYFLRAEYGGGVETALFTVD